jgi:hypothetical protein
MNTNGFGYRLRTGEADALVFLGLGVTWDWLIFYRRSQRELSRQRVGFTEGNEENKAFSLKRS